MRITVNHVARFTDGEISRLNDPINGGWDSEPRFSRYADITMNCDIEAVIAAFVTFNEYEIIADLEVPDLNAAFHASNSINSSWLENEEVTSKADGLEGARSSSVGDIFSDPDTGEYWLVENMGFKNITHEVDVAYKNKHRAQEFAESCMDEERREA